MAKMSEKKEERMEKKMKPNAPMGKAPKKTVKKAMSVHAGVVKKPAITGQK